MELKLCALVYCQMRRADVWTKIRDALASVAATSTDNKRGVNYFTYGTEWLSNVGSLTEFYAWFTFGFRIEPKVNWAVLSWRSRDPRGWSMLRGRPHASWLRQVESYLKDAGLAGLALAWAMARRRPREYRRKVDAATRCSGVCPHT